MLRSHEQAYEAIIQFACVVKELPVTKAGKSFIVRSNPHSGFCVDSKQVIPPKLTILERYPHAFIHADEIGMTKFEGRNNDYKNVYLQLKRWIKDSSQSLPRFNRNIEFRTAPT